MMFFIILYCMSC